MIKVIFDSNGGIILQLDKWAHYYNRFEIIEAAANYIEYCRTLSTDNWKGNQPELLKLNPTADQMFSNKYRVYDFKDIRDIVTDIHYGRYDIENITWESMNEFINVIVDNYSF